MANVFRIRPIRFTKGIHAFTMVFRTRLNRINYHFSCCFFCSERITVWHFNKWPLGNFLWMVYLGFTCDFWFCQWIIPEFNGLADINTRAIDECSIVYCLVSYYLDHEIYLQNLPKMKNFITVLVILGCVGLIVRILTTFFEVLKQVWWHQKF